MRLSTSAITAILFCCVCAGLSAAEWGDFSATLVYQGDSPNPIPIAVTKDQAFCGQFNLVDESLVVGADGGIQNVAVFLYVRPGNPAPAIHPDYAGTANDMVTLENRGCRFNPRVAMLRTSQTLVVTNPDSVGHNSKIDCINPANMSINPQIPPGGQVEHQFAAPETLAALVSCSIHPWMSAKVIVKDHPYMAVTDEHGKFTIKNVPTGKWQFRFWHEKAGFIQQVEVDGAAQKWTRGVVEVDISSGANSDLGVVHVPPSVFAK